MAEHNEQQIMQEDAAVEKPERKGGVLEETEIRVIKNYEGKDVPLRCGVRTSFPNDFWKGSQFRPAWMQPEDDISNYYITIAGDTPVTTEHWYYASDEEGARRNHAEAVKSLVDKYNGEII